MGVRMSEFKDSLKIDKADINEHIETISVEIYDTGLLVSIKEENINLINEKLDVIEAKIRNEIMQKYRNVTVTKQPKESAIKTKVTLNEDHTRLRADLIKAKKQLAMAESRKRALQAKLKAIELITITISSERKASGIKKK